MAFVAFDCVVFVVVEDVVHLDAVTNTDFGVVETFPWTGISTQNCSLTLLPGEEDVYEIISHVAGGNRCLDVLEGSFDHGATLDFLDGV